MKSVVLKFSAIGCFVLFILATSILPSCKKNTTCHAYITVNDTGNHKVVGAKVVLDANNVGGQKTFTGTTDGSGNVVFDIDLPAIYNVTATKSIYPPTWYGKGLVNMDEAGKEAWLTVKIQ